jgi:hypothetical protein
MIPILEIILNGQTVIEYQRNTRLPGKQREFLDIMDIDMDKGFNLDGKLINSPTNQQRARYVAMKLFQALKSNNKGLINASCAYLANRQPGLQKVRVNEEGETISLELVYEYNNVEYKAE